jgi:trk system potassium uptake protein TrkH
MLLMFIGGSPNSMAGGIKTRTLFLILLFIFKAPNSKGYIHFNGKQIDQKLVMKALRVFLLSTLAILITIIFVRIFEPNHISTESIIFESISAFSTTGLSMGITPKLTSYSKILLSSLMFIGRVGITTIMMAISSKNLSIVSEGIEYPTSDIII